MIYIACPANVATGGTELLHQLYVEIRKCTENVRIFYVGDFEDPVSPRFLKYSPQWVRNVEDEVSNALIFPEVCLDYGRKYHKCKLFCWWLSVDNYLVQRTARLTRITRRLDFLLSRIVKDEIFRNSRIEHLAQCVYASDFLRSRGCRSMLLTDYIGEHFFEPGGPSAEHRKDVVLYNPLKGAEFTRKLMKYAHWMRFVPLEKMSPTEVMETLRGSKVYIDFGNHPGKDRFPREAALMGCVIITGKRGSAGNDIDVPIPQEYKFEDRIEIIPEIAAAIDQVFANFESTTERFDSYREGIRSERHNFEQEAQALYRTKLAGCV